MLWYWAGGGLPLPQDKTLSTVARLVILFEPEFWQWGSALLRFRWEWVAGMGGYIARFAHPLEKSVTIFRNASIHRLHS